MLYISCVIKWAKNTVSCSIHYTEMIKWIVQMRKNKTKPKSNPTKSQLKQTNILCQIILTITPRNTSSQTNIFGKYIYGGKWQIR